MKGAKDPSALEEPGKKKSSLSRGMATLLRGDNGGSNKEENQSENQPHPGKFRRNKRVLQTSLVLADVLLLALAARLVFRSHGHFGFIEATLCIVAIALGAWLSCLAIKVRRS